jgi:Uma2 family endonuclease
LIPPDSLVVCNLQKRGAYLSQTPTIIFEVLSPSTKAKDRNLKSLIYSGYGVKYYILVDPAGMFAEVYKLDNGNYRLQGEFKEESYIFELDNGCEIDFSFEDIFDI